MNSNREVIIYDQIEVDHTGSPIVGIKSERELREVGGLSDSYELHNIKVNTWPMQTKDPRFSPDDKSRIVIARQLTGSFKPSVVYEAAESALRRLENYSPTHYGIVPHYDEVVNTNLLVIAISDVHLGLRVVDKNGKVVYDNTIAAETYITTLENILNKVQHWKFEKILFIIGNDFIHTDNNHSTTTGGTYLEGATDWQESIDAGINLLLTAVQTLLQYAPVDILPVPGNHDKFTTRQISRVLKAYYYNNDYVSIEDDADTYRFYRYGKTLLGFDHGKKINPQKLAGLMATKRPMDWAETNYHRWFLGDKHRNGHAILGELGVVVEHLPALTSDDSYHHENGYVIDRGGVGIIINKSTGDTVKVSVNTNEAART